MAEIVYQSVDGRIFEDMSEAEQHEKKIFRTWMTETKTGVLCGAVLDTMDDTKEEEYWGTEKDMALVFVKQAYRMSQLGTVSENHD